jgi:hypothetical protein
METITITRISGEYKDSEGNCSEYINPYTGYSFNNWFLLDRGKKIFDKLTYKNLLKEDKDFSPEHKKTKDQLELNIIEHLEDGDKPLLYLFSFEIPLEVWGNKKYYAKIGGYDDVMDYITDYTEYHWKLEKQIEIEIPKTLIKKWEVPKERETTMTNEQKLKTVIEGMGEMTTEEAQGIVDFINWQEKNDTALQLMYKNYQIETDNKEMPFVVFSEYIYSQGKEFPTEYIKGIAALN